MINIILLFVILFPSKYLLMIFQQNRYELFRYFKWFSIDDYIKRHRFDIILVFISILSLVFSIDIIVVYILSVIKILYDGYIEYRSNYIKPLVYTNRVKRQIFTIILLDLIFVYLLFYLIDHYYYISFIILLFISEFIIVIMALINYPIELYFKSLFINKAKYKIRSLDNLINIGITGSYGKTTTKNIIYEILSSKYHTLKTPASYNTPLGISKTILELLSPLHQVFICEMGSDHLGEIDYLTKFIGPKISVVVTIGPQHLNTFFSIDNIIKEKMTMIENLPKGGLGIINIDNDYIYNYSINNKDIDIITVGIDRSADLRAINIQYNTKGSEFDVKYSDNIYHFKTKLLGKYNIINILVSIAIGLYLKVDINNIIRSISECPYIKNRLELKEINGFTFIDNSFNSNYEGFKMSIDILCNFSNTRFIITPGLIDLGFKQKEYNYQLGQYMVGKVDICILIGDKQISDMYQGLIDNGFNKDNIIIFDHVLKAFDYIYRVAKIDDIILLENDLPDAFNR